MTKVKKRKGRRWSNKALKAEVEKLDDTIELYWHYNDEFCTNDVATIFEKGLEGLDEISMAIQDMNWEEFDRMKEEAIERRLDAMRLFDKVSDKTEKRFRAMVEDSEKLLTDCNLRQLARNTGAVRCVVIVNEPQISFQAWRGVESKHQVDELCELCTILNVNPKKLQSFVTCDNDNRPSYDPEPAIFPDHPEREGHEYVTIESVVATLNETSYGGQLVFMFELPLVGLIENPDGYTKGDIRIKKGTLGLIFEYMNGAGSCEDMELLKDLELKAGTFSLELDAGRKWGLQACYGFTDQPWKQGSVESVTSPCRSARPTSSAPS
jgi:hypothetical protein